MLNHKKVHFMLRVVIKKLIVKKTTNERYKLCSHFCNSNAGCTWKAGWFKNATLALRFKKKVKELLLLEKNMWTRLSDVIEDKVIEGTENT